MKNIFLNTLGVLMLGASVTACGDSFLDTKMYDAIDLETGLTTTSNIGYALNGTYDRLYRYYFAGNYATMIGDIASDIAYWNQETNHFNPIYQYIYADTDTYLYYIWSYGYKVADNSARIIKAADEIYESATDDDKLYLDLYKAEAYALRAYAHLYLVNVFGHQVMVNGNSFKDNAGVVIVDQPISVTDNVSRSTVGQVYDQIISDLNNSIAQFKKVGGDQGDLNYFNLASVYGLLARTQLYLENYSEAAANAKLAIEESGITSLTYSAEDYMNLYAGGASNVESMFALDINSNNNWSANSCGTLWTTYGYNPSPYLLSLYAPGDIRRVIVDSFNESSTELVPVFNGGKFGAYGTGNPANATNYLINAPEMFLIQAEAALKQGNVNESKNALLVVAKRNPAIASAEDLPSSSAELMDFIKDERARELFQEGHRLWDLRRWDEKANVYAIKWPAVAFTYSNYRISELIFPIPSDEINTKAGVEQTPDWGALRPK